MGMKIQLDVALGHLTHRRRQTLVSLSGVVLGVGFFLGVSSLMRGSEKDFLKRMVDNSPHVTVSDEYRKAQPQPAWTAWPDGAVLTHHVKPPNEPRGIRGHRQILEFIEAQEGVRAAPVLQGTAVLTFSGKQQGVTLSGVIPAKMRQVTTIDEKFINGDLEALNATPNGIVIGQGLADKFSLRMGSTLSVLAPSGQNRTMKVVGIFRTGNASYDEGQTFMMLKRAQGLLDKPNRVNRIIVQMADPYAAKDLGHLLEDRFSYKSVSWIEASEDILSLLLVRNTIMYSVVSAILLVASFGIYNTISTIVMEKTKDIAILKSMGFHARDIRMIFLFEGLIVGVIGSTLGLLMGAGLIAGLAQLEIKAPGMTEKVHLPVWWGAEQFALAALFAMGSCVLAAYLPARKAGRVQPVDILRGAT
ncbi:ABC transporter permease [Aquabacterium sp.]|uniref:ABC transporter permease n=1 Tax=Aquabacterium sp. TaxID=1872578 RepID=UPI002E36A472|nr:ABC transporter permease [Aquabacterium sp.]HEX5311015.1 ABC transporter permease [Aquabacterium sp.]